MSPPPAMDTGTVHAKLRLIHELLDDLEPLDGITASQLIPSAGLRNVLTHEYAAIDLQIVSASVPSALKDYREYVREIAGFVLAE